MKNKTEIVKSVSGAMNKTMMKVRKHSPEILVVAGIAGTVVSAIIACKATTKVNKIVEDTKNDIDKVHTATKTGVTEAGESYSAEDSKKDLTIIYVQTGIKFAKLYAPAVILGTLSITSILASNNILRKRNVALGAAYAAIDKSFKEYRSRVVGAVTPQHHQLTLFVTRGKARHQHHMVSRDLAGGNATSRLCDIYGGFEVMANGKQFFNRVNHRDVMTARFQQAGHNGD